VTDGGGLTYAAVLEKASRFASWLAARDVRPGSRVVLALGKVLLAQLPPDELDIRLSARPLERMTDQSITDPAELRRQLDDVRAAGVAWEQCESNPDVACVAAPVWNAQGENVAAMSISAPATRVTPERREVLSALVTGGTRKLSGLLGYSPRRSAM